MSVFWSFVTATKGWESWQISDTKQSFHFKFVVWRIRPGSSKKIPKLQSNFYVRLPNIYLWSVNSYFRLNQTLNLQLGSPFNYIWTMSPQLFWVASKFLNVYKFDMKMYTSKPLPALLVRNAELWLAESCKLSCRNHTRSGTLTATTCIRVAMFLVGSVPESCPSNRGIL